MTPKEKAKQLVDTMYAVTDYQAKQSALIAVQEIINSNPHSNLFNTDVYSTMSYWLEVKQEIEKL